MDAAKTLMEMQPLKLDEWKVALVAEFIRQADMTPAEADSYVYQAGDDCWDQYWKDAHTPASACAEDMSYWDAD